MSGYKPQTVTVMGNSPPCGDIHGASAVSTAICPGGYSLTGTGYLRNIVCSMGGANSSDGIAGFMPAGDRVILWPEEFYYATFTAIAVCSKS